MKFSGAKAKARPQTKVKKNKKVTKNMNDQLNKKKMHKKTQQNINNTIESIMQERALLCKENITIDKDKINKLKLEKKREQDRKFNKQDKKLKKIMIMKDIKGTS
eukprot:CAMPEP_0168345840 /NCGR_PEP_ID=MMETSP0213-20121227/17837_1 /TAXON_ID=151035 /ORGANISM="Euplotes harpa, Strain FSP1.4" /LENGTH=104 /DNA_ID=CAMNT_0008354221 /DNA_START=26 /DNA_END=340 /DNA_ORIENTATION=+